MAAADTYGIIIFIDLRTDFHELGGNRLKVLRDDIFQKNVAAGCCRETHERSGLNLVRNDRIRIAVELLHAADTDDVGTGALDVCAEAV